MTTDKYQLVSIYLNEADKWKHHPLHLELLKYLFESGCAGGTVLRGLAGFTKGAGIVTTSLVDVGSKLPVVVQFVEASAKVDEVMPTLRQMAGKRLITVQEIQVVPADPPV
jgi:PII-like signaling protein